MKSFMYITLLLLFGTSLFAQKPMPKGHRPDFTPEQHATLQTKQLTLLLDLNPNQIKQVEALQLEQAKKRETLLANRKKDIEKGEKPSQETLFQLKSQKLDNQIAFQSEMKKILNEEQYQLWKEIQRKRGQKKQRRKKERPMHKERCHKMQNPQ